MAKKQDMRKLYEFVIQAVIRFLVAWCRERGRMVHYVHSSGYFMTIGEAEVPAQELYLTRYVLFGHMTGDPEPRGLRARLPNLYLHQIHRPDADTSVHNHPWPWGLAIGLLGGYTEKRFSPGADHQLERALTTAWHVSRVHRAPFLNYISGKAFHRIHELFPYTKSPMGDEQATWTLFLAGPRANAKPWGYLVPGRGFVDQRDRHEEIGAREVRGSGLSRGPELNALGAMYGVPRRRWFIFTERDKAYRARIRASFSRHWATYDAQEQRG